MTETRYPPEPEHTENALGRHQSSHQVAHLVHTGEPHISFNWSKFLFRHGPSNGPKRLVLLSIAQNADEAGMAWPSVATLAKRSCLSTRQVRRLLRQLEKEGWLRIVVKRGRKDSGTYTTNDYHLLKPD